MARLSFGPSKKKIVFGPCKIFCFLIPPGTIFRNKIFCRDLFKKNNNCRDQKLQNGSRHHVPRMQIITKMGSETILKNKKFCRVQNNFFLQGPKLKRAIFAKTSAIFKPKKNSEVKIYLYNSRTLTSKIPKLIFN